MKHLTLLLLGLITQVACGQTTFTINNFSKDYYGKLYIADTTEVFSKGWVAIFDKKTNKRLIKVDADEMTFELHKGKVLANIVEAPYGEQSQIIYEDFNFDGLKDFALMDGQNSCYHGPSFQIYLASPYGFQYSEVFTSLAQENCGMFEVDAQNKKINTMTKSGCCWHQFSTYKVKGNVPYPIQIIEENAAGEGITVDYKEQNLIKGKMVKSTYQKLDVDLDKDNLLLSFELENHKKVIILQSNELLYYAFVTHDDTVELLFEDSFSYRKNDNVLTFSNHKVRYSVYDDKIVVNTPKKAITLPGISKTKVGTLARLKKLKLDNVKQL